MAYQRFHNSFMSLYTLLTLVLYILTSCQGQVIAFRHLSQVEEIRVTSTTELESALEQSPDGGRIIIEASSLRLSSTLRVNQNNLEIRGLDNSTTLRCPRSESAFLLRGNDVSLQNLRLIGCQQNSAVLVNSNRPEGNLTLTQITFQDNILSDPFLNGAAIQVQRCRNRPCPSLALIMEQCNFINNQAEIGGAVFAEDVSMEFRNCQFEANEALIQGGAISISGSVSSLLLENCDFQRNHVTRPVPSTLPFYGDPNGAPLETIPYWTFQFPSSAGGAILANTIRQFRAENCTFQSNLAQAGGALGLFIDIYAPNRDRVQDYSVEILDSVFEENRADYTENFQKSSVSGASNRDMNLGGALYVASSSSSFTFVLRDSTLRDNRATFGGALHMVAHDQTQPLIQRCLFDNNRAREAGGAILLRNNGQLSLFQTNQTRNSALLGGAMMLTNNAQMLMLGLAGLQQRVGAPCYFEENSASSGGGIMCSGCGAVIFQDPVFFNNTASDRGGAFFALDSDSDIGIIHGRFERNQAREGGAIAAEVTASIRISPASSAFSTQFFNNSANSGGAIYAKANHQRENRVYIDKAIFSLNSAVFSDMSTVCGNGGGGAICFLLNEIPSGAVADYLLEDCTITENSASIGGGAYIQVQDISWTDGGEGRSRCPTAKPTNVPCRSFRLGNSTITNNEAQFGGGGMFINDPEALAVFCPREVPFKTSSLRQVIDTVMESETDLNFIEDLLCTRIEDNSIENDDFGPNVGTEVYSLMLLDPLESIQNHTGGDRLLPPCEGSEQDCTWNRSTGIQVSVLDAFDQRISGGIEDAQLSVVLISDSVIGEQRYTAENGTININNTIGVGINSSSRILIQSTKNRTLETALEFFTRSCLPGENATLFSCQVCLPNQYSFDPKVGCRDCEDRAICQGKAALVPQDGYWHSTPFSPQFHECIVKSACEYDNRVSDLTAYYNDLTKVAKKLAELEIYTKGRTANLDYTKYEQCAKGYRGVLCGSCEEGYGHFPGGECVECPTSRTGSSFVAVLVAIWTAVFLGINIFTTFSSTQRHIQMAIYEQKDANQRSMEMQNLRSGEGYTFSESSRPNNESTQRTRIVSMIKLTEILKIFINYLQVTSVALAINLNWQIFIKRLLSIEALVVGVTSGSYLVPFDCSFDDKTTEHGVPNSIKVLWIQVAFPFLLLLFFSTICCIYLWRAGPSNGVPGFASLRSYFIVIAIVIVFFSYIRVTSELMRTVNCISVDDPHTHHVYSHYAIEVKKRVWAEDTNLHCFHGDHLWTGIFGVLGLLFFSCMVIFFILTWLPYNSQRLHDPEFVAQYGFIYQGYKEEWYCSYWEAVITIRKALIAAAVVFAFPLGPNLQGVCALGVVILATAVHFIFNPFQSFQGHPNVPDYAGEWLKYCCGEILADSWIRLNNLISLNGLESGSLIMSITIYYAGILFNDENTSEGGKHTMAAFTLVLNLAFIIYMLYRLYCGAHLAVNLSCDQLKRISNTVSIPSGTSIFAFVRKCILLLRNRNVLASFARTMTMKRPLDEHI